MTEENENGSESEQLAEGLYRYVDYEHGNVVYVGMGEMFINSVDAVPLSKADKKAPSKADLEEALDKMGDGS